MLTRRHRSCLLLASLVMLCSCSKEQLEKAVTQVQEQVKVVEKEVERIASNGSVELKLGKEQKIDSCSAALLVLGDGRPNVLQLKTYSSSLEQFPSLLFQATTEAKSLQELVGKNVTGELYVALDDAADVWRSEPKAPATISIRSIENNELAAQLSPTPVQSPDGRTSSASGMFHAVIDSL